MSDELPQGWVLAAIGQICRLVNGRTFKPSDWTTNGLPIVRIQNLNDLTAPFNYSDKTVDDKFLIDSGDLLFAWSGTPGTSFGAHIWNRGKAILNQHIYHIHFDETLLDMRFVRFAINSKLDYLIGLAHGGAGLAHVTKPMFEATQIALPPLPEQQRIVEKLEKLLSRVNAMRVRLATIPRILKRFRQSILAAACSGRLTADWREQNIDIEPASKLMRRVEQSILQEKRKRKQPLEQKDMEDEEFPATWETIRIRDICIGSFYGPRFGRDEYVAVGIPTIRTTDMTDDGRIVLKDPPRVKVSENKLESFRAQKNDLLVTRTGSIGVMAVFRDEYVAIPSAYLIRFRFTPLVSTDYVFHFLKSVKGQSMLGLGATAVTQPNINAEVIKDLRIPLPPVAEQQEIVGRVEGLFKMVDVIEARSHDAKEHVDKLTQSILARAFRGELVAQDPKDEPASALLERIRRDRQSIS